MSLRKKVICIVGLTLIVTMLLLYAGIGYFFMKNFSDNEEEGIERDVRWVEYIVSEDLGTLDRQLFDWAQWDDTYAFVEDHNQTFVESNLPVETLINLGTSAIVISDNQGNIVASKSVDFKTGEEIALSGEIKQQLQPGSLLSTFPTLDSGHSGIISFSTGPAFIATRPIITSVGGGPSRGTMAFVRMIDDEYSKRISSILGHPFQFALFGSGDFPPDFQAATTLVRSPGDIHTTVRDGMVAGYGVIGDVFGSPFFYYKVDKPMDKHAGTGGFMILLAVSLGLAGTLASGLIFFTLYRLVFSRIRYLNDVFSRIRSGGLRAADVKIEGDDDLARLAKEINEMLQAALKVREHGDIAEKRFEAISDNIPALVWMIGRDKQCMYMNKQSEDVVGKGDEKDFVQNWQRMIHEEDRAACLDGCSKAFEDRQPITMEYRVAGKKKDYRWILDNGVPYYSSPGVFLGYLHVAFDITDRKAVEQSEVEKRKEAERLNAIMVSRELRMIELKKEIRELQGGREGNQRKTSDR